MKIKVRHLPLGPLGTNAVVILNEDQNEAILIDPSFQPEELIEWFRQEGILIRQIWITHGHADHTAGVPAVMRAMANSPELVMSEEAYQMVLEQGDQFYGLPLEPFPKPTRFLKHGESLGFLGSDQPPFIADTRFAPGHAPGSLVFYLPDVHVAVVGDVIFREGVGRWDFKGGNFEELIHSIKEQVFSLPDETVLIPGHGPLTTVGWEKAHNPYLI